MIFSIGEYWIDSECPGDLFFDGESFPVIVGEFFFVSSEGDEFGVSSEIPCKGGGENGSLIFECLLEAVGGVSHGYVGGGF